MFLSDKIYQSAIFVLKENLTLAKKSIPQKIEEVVNPTNQKFELLLAKLSFYSKIRKLSILLIFA